MIVQVSAVLFFRTVVDSNKSFDNPCSSHFKSQSELYDGR